MIKTSLFSLGAGVAFGALLLASPSMAQGLSGKVTSEAEPTMEGVLVTAKKEGSTIATTVVTDDKGNFSFPADRIAPGKYTLAIRAVGYVLDGPKSVDVPEGKAGAADIKLSKTKNLAAQLSNAEWLMSMPGTDKEKQFLDACSGCHTYQRIVNSTYEAEDFRDNIFKRMGSYSPGSMPTKPQPLLPGPRGERPAVNSKDAPAAAELLARANLSQGPSRSYELKTLPRPKGRATKVVITEYDLPAKDWQPHDVIMDREGMVWFSDFGDQRMGRMDPRTGKVEAFSRPMMKTDGSPKGGLEIGEAPNGDIWQSGMYQGGVYRWERATGQVHAYKIPDKWQTPSTQESMVSPQHSDVDGYVWTNDQQDHSLLRINTKTFEYEQMGETKDAAGKPIPGYGMPTDLQNRPMLHEFSGTRIGWYDPSKKVAEVFTTPFQGSAPRRGRVDTQGRLWFAEYRGNAIGMFDPKTKEIKEYKLKAPWATPYDVVATKSGEVWAGAMTNDMVNRLDTVSGEEVDYLLPRPTNIRRVFVDERGAKPVLWVGSNHGASVVKVEPLD
jgi:virginiamycin B lyase